MISPSATSVLRITEGRNSRNNFSPFQFNMITATLYIRHVLKSIDLHPLLTHPSRIPFVFPRTFRPRMLPSPMRPKPILRCLPNKRFQQTSMHLGQFTGSQIRRMTTQIDKIDLVISPFNLPHMHGNNRKIILSGNLFRP